MKTEKSHSARKLLAALTLIISACGSIDAAVVDSFAQSADFSYAIMTQNDPAKPGEKVPFAVTVTNITSSSKTATLTLVVPNHVGIGNYTTGSTYPVGNDSVAPGASQTYVFTPQVDTGVSAPADGTMIDFTVRDLARAISFSRSFEVQSAREEELKLSCATGIVAPGAGFTYTLAYHNGRLDPIVGAKLTLKIPTNATFVSAEGGGTQSGGTIQWALGTLAPGVTGQLQARFTAPPTAGSTMLLDAAFLDSTDQVLSQASDVKTVESSPVFSYVLTTQRDTAKPGEKVPLEITVTNLSSVSQTSRMTMEVPNYCRSGNYDPGTTDPFDTLTIGAGATKTLRVTPTLDTGIDAPPDGSILNFIIRDKNHGASVSRSIIVQSAPLADLQISSAGGTVAPGGNFSYTLAYHNSSPAAILGARISLPVPANATFVSADSGGNFAGGAVTWPLGNLASGKSGQVQVTFTAPPSLSAAMLLDARLLNNANQVLAQASDVKSMAIQPIFAYALSTQGDTLRPDEKVPFVLTVTNLTNSTQSTTASYSVPRHCSSGFYDAGDTNPLPTISIPAGASESIRFSLLVDSGDFTPMDGSIANVVVIDGNQGARVSRSVGIQSIPTADLELSSSGGHVAPGQPFIYHLSYHNQSTLPISGAKLELPIPAGATFVSADNGGILANGVVQWSLGNLPTLKSGRVRVTLNAPAQKGPAMLLDARLRNNTNDVLARASHVKAISITPTFAYVLTSQSDNVIPGQRVPYLLTVTNLTNSAQSTTPTFTVPNHCRHGGYDPGDTVFPGTIQNLAAGASRTISFEIDVEDQAESPPDGSILNISVTDLAEGASVSRAIVAQSVPKADLKLSTPTGTVAPGAGFSYTLTYQNRATGIIPSAKLRMPIPKGAGFVSANAGGKVVGGNVEWSLGNVPTGGIAKVQANFSVAALSKACMLIEAELVNGLNEVLATASDVKAIYAQPVFSYALNPELDEATPGADVPYQLVLTNQTNSAQICSPAIHVPQGSTSRGYAAGWETSFYVASIPSRASTSVAIDLTIPDGTDRPPEGTLVNLVARDPARGASVSHTMAVGKTIYTHGTIIRNIELSGDMNFGKVLMGQSKTKLLTIRNSGTSALVVSSISFPDGFSSAYAGAIPIDGAVNVPITFKPTAGKTYSGNLTVNSNRTGGNHLRGLLGIGANRAIVLGGNLNFGKVKVRKKKTLVLTISNPGNEPLKVSKLIMPPGFKAKFAGTINPGSTQRIVVTFSPIARKSYKGTVIVSSDRTSGVVKRPISGTGT